MIQLGLSYRVQIEDVQAVIDETIPLSHRSTSFDFTSYHTLEEIYKNFEDLTKQYPDKVQVVDAGKTYENHQIKGVKLSFGANNPGIFVEGGIHAREWISSATVMYTLHQLLTSKDANVRALAESHDWYIFPVFNPDGYVYTHTTVSRVSKIVWNYFVLRVEIFIFIYKTLSLVFRIECGGRRVNHTVCSVQAAIPTEIGALNGMVNTFNNA